MAEGSVIGALRFVLGADTAQLEAATQRASRSMRDAAKAGEAAGSVIAGALTRVGGMITAAFATDRIVAFAVESLRSASALGRFADQAGMTAQQFQGLDHALRDARVPTEQLAQGFAIFSRNLSDMRRNTGPFLDFLRRFAPSLEGQFRAANGTAEAFTVLANAVRAFGSEQDRVRLLNAAGAEQFTRLANAMRQGGDAINEQARAFRGLSDEAIRRAQEIERRWTDLSRNVTLAMQQAVIATVDFFASSELRSVESIEREIRRVQGIIDNARNDQTRQNGQRRLNELTEQHIRLLEDRQRIENSFLGLPPPAPPPSNLPRGLTPDQIREMQGEIALLIARIQTLPATTEFVSENFAEAWARMEAVLRQTGETEFAIAAQRLNLLRQEDQARVQVLGNAMRLSEQFTRRERELHHARAQGIISELEQQRALNIARLERSNAQLSELQSLGVTLTVQEQYAQTLNRISIALQRNAIDAAQAGRAQQSAAFAANAAWGAALGGIAQNLASAFGENKFLASAAALISTWEAANKALAIYGPTPLGFAAAAAAVAAGIANVVKINSTGPGKGVSTAGAGALPAAQQAPTQTAITLNLRGGDMFSAAQVQQLISELNEHTKNGHVLIATRVR